MIRRFTVTFMAVVISLVGFTMLNLNVAGATTVPAANPRVTLVTSFNPSVANAAGEWSVVSTSTPSGLSGFVGLWDVSCTKATFCLAVGDDNSTDFAEMSAGSGWSFIPAPFPEGFAASVSCLSTSWCMAIGMKFWNSPDRVPLEWGIVECVEPNSNRSRPLGQCLVCERIVLCRRRV